MNREEFKNYIKSIGFVNIRYNRYEYKHYIIYIHTNCYYFDDGYSMMWDLNDLTPLGKIIRSIKLKQILNVK